ncbi:MAG: DUF4159 domain-containing protein [Beijerinckiaceae bacterium]
MFGLPLAFATPAVLVALAGLPALYFLLRITPPRPRRIPFPPLRLILDLRPKDLTPAHTPWWLLVLRLAIAAAIILAMAGPVLNPLPTGEASAGPLLVVLDDGWPAAPAWAQRVAAAVERIEAAGRRGQTIAVASVSDAAREINPTAPAHALERLRAIKPLPYVPDRHAFLSAIEKFVAASPQAEIVWIADGLERGGARDFAERLAALSPHVTLITDSRPPRALAGPRNEGGSLEVYVLRAAAQGAAQGLVRALDRKGLAIGEAQFDFTRRDAIDATETKAGFDLPVELRNEIARLEIVDEHSAGAVSLLDERWKRRRVGIVSGETADLSLPLLAPNYYLDKALAPFADVREARPGTNEPIQSLLDENVAVLILADVGAVSGPVRLRLERFVADGGMLVRFAGTRLANGSDDLVPVRLRRGGRILGGALSWETPKKLAPFEHQSPFFGLDVPDEVTVTRQVLAEPDAGLPAKTWGQLVDGTPLVTAATRGKGRLVLFHVTADTTWSNLPLSGLFVDMLRKIVSLASETAKPGQQAVEAAEHPQVETLPPNRGLDGFGVLGAPSPIARPVPVNFDGIGDSEHPPGFYGPPDALLAVNAMGPKDRLVAADYSGLNFQTAPLREAAPLDLRPPLLAVAFLLFIADSLASLWLAGSPPKLRRRAAAAAALVLLAVGLCAAPAPLRAEPRSEPPLSRRDLDSALNTRLAYVVSGDARVDEISRNGLLTLTHVLATRTSLTPAEPGGIDPGRDELAFYSMLYWPIVASRPQPSPATIAKVAAFMKQGGTIIFDTRDALQTHPGGPPTPEAAWLRQLLDGVDVPELERVPVDHVVTKTFYLLDGFVGRYATGETCIEALPPPNPNDAARPARSGDGVSPIILTSNDLAAGWAAAANGESLYTLVPGGGRQHEMALRGGVNLVMYTLTGNYKADQVHVRDLLERLAH